jgi:hypothetical protein
LSFAEEFEVMPRPTPRKRSKCRDEILITNFNSEDDACGPDSPKHSIFSRSHEDSWCDSSETLLILDWDDTLYPTTFTGSLLIQGKQEDPDEIQAHADAVRALLSAAADAAHVAIVTMAVSEWVQSCMEKHMPGLSACLTELGVDIVTARRNSRGCRKECREPSQFLKTQAIAKVVRDFYSGPELEQDGSPKKRSWKNIMSIGDSSAERLALQDVVFRHQQRDRDGVWKECRCKTLTLLNEPTRAQLTQELRVITQWLPTLLHHDGDLDLDYSTGDFSMVPNDECLEAFL